MYKVYVSINGELCLDEVTYIYIYIYIYIYEIPKLRTH